MGQRETIGFCRERERMKIVTVGFCDDRLRPLNRAHAVMVEIIERRIAHKTAIVVSFQNYRAAFADEIHALVRKRSVPDGISQAIDRFSFQILDLLQDLLESLEVAMDIGEDSDEHAGASDR